MSLTVAQINANLSALKQFGIGDKPYIENNQLKMETRVVFVSIRRALSGAFKVEFLEEVFKAALTALQKGGDFEGREAMEKNFKPAIDKLATLEITYLTENKEEVANRLESLRKKTEKQWKAFQKAHCQPPARLPSPIAVKLEEKEEIQEPINEPIEEAKPLEEPIEKPKVELSLEKPLEEKPLEEKPLEEKPLDPPPVVNLPLPIVMSRGEGQRSELLNRRPSRAPLSSERIEQRAAEPLFGPVFNPDTFPYHSRFQMPALWGVFTFCANFDDEPKGKPD